MDHVTEITSLNVNKLSDSHDKFIKYDIDVALDEVESNESSLKIKYKIALLSNPTNSKMTMEGFVTILGNELEITKQLEPDQMNIPRIVNVIYQDNFPLIYIISKSLQIPCPSYKLAQISKTSPQVTSAEQPKNPEPVQQSEDSNSIESIINEIELPQDKTEEPVIQEAKVS